MLAFFKVAAIKGKLIKEQIVGRLIFLVGWWALEEVEVDVHMVWR